MKLNKSKMKDKQLITDITLKPQEPDDKLSKQENTCDCFVLSFNFNSGGEKIPFEISLSIKETNHNIFGKQHWVTLHKLKDNSVTFDVNMEFRDGSGVYKFALYQIITKNNNNIAQDVQEKCLLDMLSKCIQKVQSNRPSFDSDHPGLTVLNKKIQNIKLPTLSNEDRQKIDSIDLTEQWNKFKEQNQNPQNQQMQDNSLERKAVFDEIKKYIGVDEKVEEKKKGEEIINNQEKEKESEKKEQEEIDSRNEEINENQDNTRRGKGINIGKKEESPMCNCGCWNNLKSWCSKLCSSGTTMG